MTDYKQLLNDFVADVNQNPNLTDEELLTAYPELNDGSLLDAAWAYRNTLNEKNYDEATLQSKFPEFFGGDNTPQEKSFVQSIGAHNPYQQLSAIQNRELKADEVVRPQEYETEFTPDAQKGSYINEYNKWLQSPYQSLSNEELDEQIYRLQHPHDEEAKRLYKVRHGKDYVEPQEPTGWWDKYGFSRKAQEYANAKSSWSDAVLSAAQAEQEENPEAAKLRNDRLARLTQEKTWRNRQEVMPAIGEQINELQERILTNPKQDGRDMNGAKHLLNKSIDLYNAPSKYGKGNGIANWGKGLIDQITDYDTWTAGVTDVARMANLNGIVNKMNKQEQLTNEEELVLEAFLLSSAVQDVRFDLSAGYTVGKGAAESIPFVAEMFLTAGAGAAAKKGIVTLAERKLGQAFADKLARSLGGTVIKDAAGKAVERGATKTMAGKVGKTLAYDFTQTAVMPSTYAKLYQDRVDEILKGDGDFDFLDFARSFTGSMVETGTERWGGKIIDKGVAKIIPFNAKALWGNNKAFGEFVENYIQSPIGETGEEVIGAAVNTLRSFNPLYNNVDETSISGNANLRGELGEMLTPEGLGQTFLTILPMSVFGGVTNLGFNKAYAKYSISNYTKQKEALHQLLQDNGATDEQANRIISQIESSEDDKAFMDKLEMTLGNLTLKHRLDNPDESKEDYEKFKNNLNKALGKYAKSAGRYNSVIGKLQDAYKKLPDEEKENVDRALFDYEMKILQDFNEQYQRREAEQQTTAQEETPDAPVTEESVPGGVSTETPTPIVDNPLHEETSVSSPASQEDGTPTLQTQPKQQSDNQLRMPKKVTQQLIRIELDGKPVNVRYTVSRAVWNEDGSLNTEKSSKVLVFPNDPKGRYGSNFGSRTEEAVAALQEALRKQREEAIAAQQQQEQAETVQPTASENVAGDVVPPIPSAEGTPQGEAPTIVGEESVPAPKPYPIKEDGTPDFEQIGTDPDMSVAAAHDMGLDENALIDNSVARIDEEIAATQKNKKMSVLEQMARVDALQKEKARWENLRKTEENAGNEQESLNNQEENSNFANEGGQQNDTGGIQRQGSTGSRENVEPGRQGQSIYGGGTQENTPDGGNEMRLGGGSLPNVSITNQLDEQNSSIDNLLQAKGIRATQKKVVRVTAQSFHDAIAQGKVHNTMGWCVDVHDAADYENDICLLTEDGQAGIAITPDGDIISLFSNGNGKGVANKLIPMAIAMGGRKADFYSTDTKYTNNGLQNLYARFGAKVVAQTPFSEEFVRETNPEWVEYEKKLAQKYISEGLAEEEAREKAHAEAIDHPLGACIFPATAEEAIEFKAQNPQYTVDMDKVEKFEGENGYGKMMEHRDKELEKEKQQPTGDNEVLNLEKDKSIVILTHPIKSHYPLVRIARMSIEDGKTVYREIGNDNVLDTESGFWVPNKKKEIVKNGGVRYLVVENEGKKRGIPVRSTIGQLAKINQQNVLKVNGKNVTGTRGLTDVRIDRRAQANEEWNKLTTIDKVFGKPLIKDPITGQGITLLDILQLRPKSFEVQKTDKDGKPLYDENNQPITEMKVMSIWEQIQAMCDKIAQESRNASDEKYNTHSTEEQVKEQSYALQTDFSAVMPKIIGAWNRVCEKNSVDAIIQRQLDNIDSDLIETYWALRKAIYDEGRGEIPTAQIPDKKLVKSGGQYTQQDSNIFRYMQVVAEIVRQAEDVHNDEVQELNQKAEKKRLTSEEETIKTTPVMWDSNELLVEIPWYVTGKSQEERKTPKKSKNKTDEDWLADIDKIDNATDLKKKWIDIKKTILYKENKAFRDRVEDAVDAKAAKLGVDIDYLDAGRKPQPKARTIDDVENDLTTAKLALEDAMGENDFDSVEQLNKRIAELSAEKESIINSQTEMQRGGNPKRATTPAQRFVTNVLMKALGKVKGITVHRATQEDVQRVLERIKRKSSLDTEIVELFGSPLKVSVISSEDGARIRKNLSEAKQKLETATWREDNLHTKNAADVSSLDDTKLQQKIDTSKRKFENQNIRNVKNPVALLANALELRQTGSSYYGTFQLQDGSYITLRLSNHNATVSNFDNEGETEGVSIVISAHPSAGIRNDGEAHVIEYFYRKKDLWDAYGTPLADILGDISELLRTGKYQDTTGLAKVEEVNRQDFIEAQSIYNNNAQIETFETPDGTVYGWAVGNEIYLTEDGLNPETPIHEYTHLWAKAMENADPKGWAKIVRLCKANKALWESVQNDPNYANIKDSDSRIASEVLSRYAGEHGVEKLVQEAERMAKDGKSFESDVESKLFVSRMKNVLKSFWGWVKEKLGIENLDDISNRSLYDLLNGTDLGLEELGLTTEEKHIAEQAKANGTYMQAPNGKPSNLSPKQWLQTRTEAFKEWFGDWKDGSRNSGMLLDENGEPKVVYRGSTNDDYVFRSRYGEGTYWFTDNREAAEHYARRGANHDLPDYELDGRVQPVFIKLGDSSTYNAEGRNWENVYNEPVYQIVDDESGNITAEFKTREEAERYCEENGLDPEIEILESNGVTGDIAEQQFAAGKTGVVFENVVDGGNIPSNVYVVRDNGQAKSATENNGAFDEGNPDIRFQIESGEIGQIDQAVEQRIKRLSDEYRVAQYDPKVPMPEKIDKLSRYVNQAFDQGEGLRQLYNRMNEVRKYMGKKPLSRDKYDIRALNEQAEAAIAGRQKLFEDRTVKGLQTFLYDKKNGFVKAVQNSNLYKRYKDEQYKDADGNMQPIELTAEDLIDRYLIARDTIDRMENGIPPRGIAEFTQRMGVDMVTFVREFQEEFGKERVTELHNCVKDITDATLDILKEGQLITDEDYARYKSRNFYVAEKGFSDQDAEDLARTGWEKFKQAFYDDLGKISRHTGRKKSIKPMATTYRARGGDSLASNVLGHILQDGYDAIEKAEHNKVKLAMYNLLREDPEVTRALRLPVPEEVYYVKNEDGEWVRKTDGVTAEEKAEARVIMAQVHILEAEIAKTTDKQTKQYLYDEIDELMEAMPYADEYTTKNVWQTELEEKLQSVGVYVNGVLQEMRFPNMTEVANVLNGRLDTRGQLDAAKEVNKLFSSIATQYNPLFFSVNLARDIPWIAVKGASEYGFEFVGRFTQELANPKSCIAITQYVKGTLDETQGGVSKQFYDFITSGGQTGYARSNELMDVRRKMNQWANGNGFKNGANQVLEMVANVNEFSELYTRFAAYKAILDMGLSHEEGLKAAKNLSVNFNRRGSGRPLMNMFSSVSMFANAVIQGNIGFWRTFGGETVGKNNSKTKRILRAVTTMMIVPYIAGLVATLFSMDDDDDEKRISDWERENYWCIGNFRKPLNEQLRPFWVMGMNTAMLLKGRRTWGQAVESISSAVVMNLLPFPPSVLGSIDNGIKSIAGDKNTNWANSLRNLWMPQGLSSLNQLAEGKDWMGNELRKEYGDIPEYRMNENETAMYRDIAYLCYRIGGGQKDIASKRKANGDKINAFWDVSPKQIKNILFFIPSDVLRFMECGWGLAHAALTEDTVKESLSSLNIPLVNRFYKPTSKEMYRYGIIKETKKELQSLRDQKRNLQRQAEGGNTAAKEKLDNFTAENDERIKQLNNIVQEYSKVSLLNQSYALGLTVRELKRQHPEKDYDKIDQQEKELVQEMLLMQMDKKGVQRAIDETTTEDKRKYL